MTVDHRLLRRMQCAVADALNRKDRLAIERGQKCNTGIDGAGAQSFAGLVNAGDDDGTGAAITLCATFFGTGEPSLFAKISKECAIGIDVTNFDELAV